ncbi:MULTISPECIES: exodeoxyribonuclease VII small subunit [Clostridiaceae]|uniref:Exodeoxyribonuclease 7 small subunit n=1 Tax=Clostridium facile TaxID=2763035 RepID=A0ABR7IQ72_9CLOT|nr:MULTISPECIES: exodeoxyribonuclease VII small subunit [Clostridiaceae]MBC5787295.1 exodeoxyribonuclease VII small subunit [Clostridium facile]
MEQQLSFEKAMAELEKIVAKLEKGNLSLEQSLELYEKGTKLSAICHEKLQSAQLKIEEITKQEENSGGEQ